MDWSPEKEAEYLELSAAREAHRNAIRADADNIARSLGFHGQSMMPFGDAVVALDAGGYKVVRK